MQINDSDFRRLYMFMRERYGVNLEQKRVLIEGRLSGDIERRGFKSFTDYLDYILNDKTGDEVTGLITKLTTNYTYFMREDQHFRFLAERILPDLKVRVTDKDLRIWSAGCSSGEEPYTIAMVIDDFFKHEKSQWESRVLATDISKKVLEAAGVAVYPAERLENVSPGWKQAYFKKVDAENYKVVDRIKNEVIFRPFNLMEKTFPFRRKFHVIFCRNVMIYFDKKTRAELVDRYYDALETGGHLFIGLSESLNGINNRFQYVMPAIYRK